MSLYYVYILKSLSRNYIYVGLSNDVKRRFHQHQSGLNSTTRAYRPFKLIHSEQFADRKQARTREKYFKSGVGRDFVRLNFL